MSNLHLQDFKFLRMWPRSLFKKKMGNRLLIKVEVPEIKQSGVYILYIGDELHYVGKATRLMSRLHDHANKVTDEYYAHWNYFSAFVLADTVTNRQQKLAELEAILIAAMPRATNRPRLGLRGFRFLNHCDLTISPAPIQPPVESSTDID